MLPRPFVLVRLAAVALFVALAAGPALQARAQTGPQRSIVVLKAGVADPGKAAKDLGDRHGFAASHVYRHALKGFAAAIPADKLGVVRNDARVLFVGPDRDVELYAQTLPTGIDRIDADRNRTARIDGTDQRVDVAVAVIDTGSGPHPDLNVVGGVDCTGAGQRSYDDVQSHGTHVAGTIGALDNGEGVVGVAPGARIWSVRVFPGPGATPTSMVVCGIDWVTQHADTIEVANMSLGGPGSDDGNCGRTNRDAMHLAICASVAAGVTYAVAAGNATDDAANHTPAAYDEVITVSALADSDGKAGGVGPAITYGSGATDQDDTLAIFSNYGPDVDLAAPGVRILSTVPGGYARFSGTSMASPHVAGAAALYLTNNPGTRPEGVKSALQKTRERYAMPDDPDGINEGVANVG